MRVLCFGSYYDWSSRARILLKGLRQNNVELVECNTEVHSHFLAKYFNLVKRYRNDYDVMIVPFTGNVIVPLARTLTSFFEKPFVFDAFLSIYDTMVFDSKLVKEGSAMSKVYFGIDKFSCTLSDLVLLDTNEHIEYFHRTFGIEREKFERIFIGADDEVFYPREQRKSEDSFLVTFHGSFIPLQGVQHIVRAAKLLENYNVKFELLGEGQTYLEARSLCRSLNAKNLLFRNPVKYDYVPDFVATGDVALGIFGETEKAQRVIPTKVFEILAMEKPLITGDTPAIAEGGIIDHRNALLVEMASPRAIADAILTLRDDDTLRKSLAKRGYELFKEKFTPKSIGKTLKETMERLEWSPAM